VSVDDMILYIKNPKPKKKTPKNPVKINEFSKVAGYKINTEKSVVFLYSNSYQKKRLTKQPY